MFHSVETPACLGFLRKANQSVTNTYLPCGGYKTGLEHDYWLIRIAITSKCNRLVSREPINRCFFEVPDFPMLSFRAATASSY